VVEHVQVVMLKILIQVPVTHCQDVLMMILYVFQSVPLYHKMIAKLLDVLTLLLVEPVVGMEEVFVVLIIVMGVLGCTNLYS
jgi:hypothetical protein